LGVAVRSARAAELSADAAGAAGAASRGVDRRTLGPPGLVNHNSSGFLLARHDRRIYYLKVSNSKPRTESGRSLRPLRPGGCIRQGDAGSYAHTFTSSAPIAENVDENSELAKQSYAKRRSARGPAACRGAGAASGALHPDLQHELVRLRRQHRCRG